MAPMPMVPMRTSSCGLLSWCLPWLLSAAAMGCGDGGEDERLPKEQVRDRIARLAPAANLGHRGTGPTRQGHAFPENSLSSFIEAMEQGADGIELDLEITADGKLVVMHDDTLDRTTSCSGCVSELSLADIRDCFLLDAEGEPTDEHPPTLEESFDALPGDALVNVELKVFDEPCLSDSTGSEALVAAAVDEVERLGVAGRTLFSSFDQTAVEALKREHPQYYSGLLIFSASEEALGRALALEQDALHAAGIDEALVAAALGQGLQVNVWFVNSEEQMNASLDKGVSSIITDEPAVLADVIATR